jgi:hypothetical protein
VERERNAKMMMKNSVGNPRPKRTGRLQKNGGQPLDTGASGMKQAEQCSCAVREKPGRESSRYRRERAIMSTSQSQKVQ